MARPPVTTTCVPPVVLALTLSSAAALAHQPAPPCLPRTGEKLGVRFVEVCQSTTAAVEDDDPAESRPLPSFWISAAPLPCSAGGHETIDCPSVTPLGAAAGIPGNAIVTPQEAAVIDAATAHRLCAMRFGGRLPTPLERAQARHVLGLSSIIASEQTGREGIVQLGEIAEWTEEGECDNPSIVGPSCQVRPFPPILVLLRQAGDQELTCSAEPAPDGGDHAVDIGGEFFAAPGRAATATLLRLKHTDGPSLFALTCDRPPLRAGDAARRPRTDTAAFRCVLPTSAMGTIGPPTTTGGVAPPRRP